MGLPDKKLLFEFIDYWASMDANFPSIKYGEGKIITAQELKNLSMKAAAGFVHMGVKPGDTIVTILSTVPEFIITLIAGSRIGAIIIPLDVNYKRTDFLNLIPHSDPKIIITLKSNHKNKIAKTLLEIKDKLPNTKYIVKGNHELGLRWKEFIKKNYEELLLISEIQKTRTEEEDILVVWTGGSTGFPKAVLVSNKNFIAMTKYEVGKFYEWSGNELGKDRVKFLANLPVSHVGGTIEMIGTSLISGMQLITQKEWSPWPALQLMKDEEITLMGGVPTMFSIFTSLSNLQDYEPKKYLKAILMSGSKVSLDLLKKISETMCSKILIGYGSTEAGAEVTFTSPGDSYEDLANGYVGIPVTGTDIKIVDNEGNILPPNSEGEILVKGDITSKRYYKMPEETKHGFTSDGYCRTGDLGHLDENGGLWITGRVKFIIRVGSYTVLPSEIEDVVNTAKNVLCSAAFGVPDEIYEQSIWLVIAPDPGTMVNEEEIKDLLERELAKYKIPKKIIIYEADSANLPFTSIGKVDRPRLQRELNIPQP